MTKLATQLYDKSVSGKFQALNVVLFINIFVDKTDFYRFFYFSFSSFHYLMMEKLEKLVMEEVVEEEEEEEGTW